MRINFTEAEVCAIIDGLNTLLHVAYEEDDEREEEIRWLQALVKRLEMKVGIAE